MSETLKAWCRWKRVEVDVSEDDLMMVDDIEALFKQLQSQNEIIKDLVEVVEFYALVANPIHNDNTEVIANDGFRYDFGGKRAREVLNKHADKIKEFDT